MKNKINIPLLLEIKEQILQHPEEFKMEIWLCDTCACIGGWAKLLAAGKTSTKQYLDVWNTPHAGVLLGLTEDQGDILFLATHWPNEIRIAFQNAATCQQRAKIAAKRIDLFIATNGAQ